MTETPAPKHTHKLVIEGNALTTASIADQSALYERIKPAFEALAEALKKEGGTLTCVPARIAVATGPRKPKAPAGNGSAATDPTTIPAAPIPGTVPRHRDDGRRSGQEAA